MPRLAGGRDDENPQHKRLLSRTGWQKALEKVEREFESGTTTPLVADPVAKERARQRAVRRKLWILGGVVLTFVLYWLMLLVLYG